MNSLFRFSGRSGIGLISAGLPLAMFALLSIAAPNFLSYENIANVNNQITALLIVALGQLIVALIGGIDISVGSVVSLTSVVLASFGPTWAIPVALALALVIGMANGTGVVVFGVHPLVMTLATMTFVQGLALSIMSGAGGVVPEWIGAMVWGVLAIALASVLLYFTRFGLRLFALGANVHSASLSGIRTVAPRIACYVICALSGCIASIYLTGRISTGDPMMGQSFGLDSVTAIALGGVQLAGGTGSVLGAVLGTITLGLITNGMNLLGISPFLRTALTGMLLLAAVSLQRRKAIGI
jgi:ribose transport system permease protein